MSESPAPGASLRLDVEMMVELVNLWIDEHGDDDDDDEEEPAPRAPVLACSFVSKGVRCGAEALRCKFVGCTVTFCAKHCPALKDEGFCADHLNS